MKLSIITINYNNKKGLEKTINSVKKQINPNYTFEYIVIDGLSSDGSCEVIKNNEAIIAKFIIESDSGIADAFNKGIKLSVGDYILFLNSGDTLFDKDSLQAIFIDTSCDKYDIIINNIVMVDDKNKKFQPILSKNMKLIKQKYRNYFPHQGMIIKRELFSKYGLYDLNYRLGMDYEWSLRLLHDFDKINIKLADNFLCKMYNGGISQTEYIKTFIAYHEARKKNNTTFWFFSLLFSYFFILKRTCGNIIRKLINK